MKTTHSCIFLLTKMIRIQLGGFSYWIRAKSKWYVLYTHDLDLGYTVGREDMGWGKETEHQTMEKAERTVSASSMWPEGPRDEILLLTAWSPIALTLPGAGWHDKLLYLIWEGIGCLLVIPLVPSGKRDSKSHRCLYSEIHSLTPIPTVVWMEVRGPCGLGGHCVFRRGAGLRAVCGAFVSITQSLGKSKLIPHSHFYSVSMSNGPSLPRQSGTSCGSGRRERGQRRRSSKFRLY